MLQRIFQQEGKGLRSEEAFTKCLVEMYGQQLHQI